MIGKVNQPTALEIELQQTTKKPSRIRWAFWKFGERGDFARRPL
jgi:hypothetical protein